jgi:predicted deacetylase
VTRPVRQLVVSIHDVAPSSWPRVARLLEILAAMGVTRRSLLVIPNFRGEESLDRHGDFCRWLRQRHAEGDELVLHGYEHVAVGEPRTPGERFRNRWFTKGEGEFLSLEYGLAFERIARGKALMDGAGLHSRGFVAPAWLINEEGLRAARRHGFEYTNSYLTLRDLSRERTHWVPSLVFGPGHLNEDLGVALQRRLSTLLARCAAVRIVLHPPCLDHDARLAQVLTIIAAGIRDREPATYLQLLSELRRPAALGARNEHAH